MSASIDRNDRFATLSESFHHNLSLYALAASAAGVQVLALAQPSEAEVIYTPAHAFIGKEGRFSFDLNHDGVDDFSIVNRYAKGSSYTGDRLYVMPIGSGGIEYKWNINNLALVFQKGQKIGFAKPRTRNNAVMEAAAMLYGSGPVSYGYWANVTNGYLGLAFKIEGQIHFGWARLDVKTTGIRIQTLLTGYAYETQPKTPIIAGDTGGQVDADHEGQTEPVSEIHEPQEGQSPASLGALSLGAHGLAIWRRPSP